MNYSPKIYAPLLAVPFLLTSCVSMEPQRDDNLLEKQTPTQFTLPADSTVHANQWWYTFESEQLNRLMTQAFEGNLTLEQAAARLQQAAASARQSASGRKLQLDAQATGKTTSTSDNNSLSDPRFGAGLYASYEVDLWGRLESIENASIAQWEASKFDLQTAAMTLSSELTTTYFSWLSSQKKLELYESQLKSSKNQLTAIDRRYQAGQSTSLDVLQQRQQVASAEAKIPPVKASIKTAENQLAVLIGTFPGDDLGLERESLPELPAKPSTGVPIEVLSRRPDIQSARLALESADWSVGAARAARLPTLSLTGDISDTNSKINELFNDWAANLAASLFAPILDGGSRKAEVERTLAVAREKIAAYRLAALEAIEDTENALSDEKYQAKYVTALARQHAAALKSEAESIRRYQRGLLTYLDTLTAIVARETLEITYVQARTDLLSDRIQLYRSLGGDWTFILEEK